MGEVKIEGISAGEIASFQLGEQIWLVFQPGFIKEGSVPPWYDEMPKLKVAVHLQSVEGGIFELGDTIVVEMDE